MYVAPADTHIETVCLDYNLRRDNHHQAEILAYPGIPGPGLRRRRAGRLDQRLLRPQPLTVHRPPGLRPRGRLPGGAQRPRLRPQHRRSPWPTTSNPVITAFGGDITDPGWLRGSKTLIADAADAGSGVYRLIGYVNGVEIGARCRDTARRAASAGTSRSRSRPVRSDVDALAMRLEHSSPPFVNGANTLMALARRLRRQRDHADYHGQRRQRAARRPRSPTTSTHPIRS